MAAYLPILLLILAGCANEASELGTSTSPATAADAHDGEEGEHGEHRERQPAPEITLIRDWRICRPYATNTACGMRDPTPGDPGWQVSDAITLMDTYPTGYLFTGFRDNRPPGNLYNRLHHDMIDELQARRPDLASRLCISYGGPSYRKFTTNHATCRPHCGWEGDMDGSKGDGPFDTNWLLRVPVSQHADTIAEFWSASAYPDPLLAPCSNRRTWNQLDCPAIQTLNSSLIGEVLLTRVLVSPAGFTGSLADDYPRMGSLAADLRIPAYRRWRAKHLLYKLEDFGFDPGEPACLLLSTSPGHWTRHDGRPNRGDPCWYRAPSYNPHMWSGPAHRCTTVAGDVSPAAPFDPPPYRHGQYEAASSAYVLDLLDEMRAAGYDGRVITHESPTYHGTPWSTLSRTLRRDPRLLGNYTHSVP